MVSRAITLRLNGTHRRPGSKCDCRRSRNGQDGPQVKVLIRICATRIIRGNASPSVTIRPFGAHNVTQWRAKLQKTYLSLRYCEVATDSTQSGALSAWYDPWTTEKAMC